MHVITKEVQVNVTRDIPQEVLIVMHDIRIMLKLNTYNLYCFKIVSWYCNYKLIIWKDKTQ